MSAASFHVQDIISGRQVAFLVPAVTQDRARAAPGAPLQSIDEFEIGSMVHEVHHVGPLVSTVGSVITVKNLPDLELAADVVILSIQLVRANQLTQQQLRDLGRPREQHPGGIDMIEEMGDRRAWLVRVMPEIITFSYSSVKSIVS